ncbi:MAG: CarD family transcriptional regulator [Desulfobacterales bacterium]|nr:CarD family transcriptional regulator [Desulfobacterales bacterium]
MAKKALKERCELQKQIGKTFYVGDLAVYPAHGVGRVESIESRKINGDTMTFYILKILENNMVIMIPTKNVESVGLRELISSDEIPKVFDILMEKREISFDNQTWNRRYREYMDKIKTGSIYDVAEVFRDLYLLKLTKDLSFGERKLLDTSQSLLIRELCIAKNVEEKVMLSNVQTMFKKMNEMIF